jgi:hypothetical protein
MVVSHNTIRFLALLTWITGGAVLFLKGYALFAQALDLRSGTAWNYLPFLIALTVGSLKARYLFLPSCRRNLARIEGLIDPRPWQFFRVGFFVFLITMISLGAWLSRIAEGNYGLLITVSSIDLTLSVGLVGSLGGFKKSPVPGTRYPEGKDVSG